MKNKVTIILSNYNEIPIIEKNDKYEFKNNKYYTLYNWKNCELNIEIESKENCKCIFEYFMIQYKLLFFNNGCFYKIKEYKENNVIVNISEKYTNIECYDTAKEYIKSYKITNISSVINKNTVSAFKKIENKNRFMFNAFYYIHSNKYKGVLYDHKFMILSQICEGYIESTVHEQEVTYHNFQNRIDLYIQELKKMNLKYRSCIFDALKISSKGLKEKIKNSRHRYSHYVEKKNTIAKGEDYVYIFYILELIFRVYILKDLKINQFENLHENLYSIHDWIISNRNPNIDKKEFKSISYKLM